MPKKSSHKKAPVKKDPSRHFLWSIFFIAMSAAINIYFVGAANALGDSYVWPMIGVLLSVITLVTIGYERKTGKLGTGKFLWSIFFTVLLLGNQFYVLNALGSTLFPVIALGSVVIALALLIYEKYNY